MHNKKTNNYEDPYVCTYTITQVWGKSDPTIFWGAIQERIKIIWIKPYHKKNVSALSDLASATRRMPSRNLDPIYSGYEA